MKRIVIIGSPGAGKTTLSRKISAITGLPLVHLDRIYLDKKNNYTHESPAWRERVKQETDKSAWIIDGDYRTTYDLRLPLADLIILLDYKRRLTLYRAIKRRVAYRNKTRSDMPEGWKENLNPTFLKLIINYRRDQRPDLLALLKKYEKNKVIILKSPAQANAFMAGFAQTYMLKNKKAHV